MGQSIPLNRSGSTNSQVFARVTWTPIKEKMAFCRWPSSSRSSSRKSEMISARKLLSHSICSLVKGGAFSTGRSSGSSMLLNRERIKNNQAPMVGTQKSDTTSSSGVVYPSHTFVTSLNTVISYSDLRPWQSFGPSRAWEWTV